MGLLAAPAVRWALSCDFLLLFALCPLRDKSGLHTEGAASRKTSGWVPRAFLDALPRRPYGIRTTKSRGGRERKRSAADATLARKVNCAYEFRHVMYSF